MALIRAIYDALHLRDGLHQLCHGSVESLCEQCQGSACCCVQVF